jgi:hypothetical protein
MSVCHAYAYIIIIRHPMLLARSLYTLATPSLDALRYPSSVVVPCTSSGSWSVHSCSRHPPSLPDTVIIIIILRVMIQCVITTSSPPAGELLCLTKQINSQKKQRRNEKKKTRACPP